MEQSLKKKKKKKKKKKNRVVDTDPQSFKAQSDFKSIIYRCLSEYQKKLSMFSGVKFATEMYMKLIELFL